MEAAEDLFVLYCGMCPSITDYQKLKKKERLHFMPTFSQAAKEFDKEYQISPQKHRTMAIKKFKT